MICSCILAYGPSGNCSFGPYSIYCDVFTSPLLNFSRFSGHRMRFRLSSINLCLYLSRKRRFSHEGTSPCSFDLRTLQLKIHLSRLTHTVLSMGMSSSLESSLVTYDSMFYKKRMFGLT